jgi:hypothetical protein
MSILTAEEVTNWYLYGQATPPADIVDGSLIRPQNVPPLEISVDGNAFMQGGQGRFAFPVLREVVNEFFNLNVGMYEKGQVFDCARSSFYLEKCTMKGPAPLFSTI